MLQPMIAIIEVEIFDRERPLCCDHCEGNLDGTEREVWVDGVRIWVHRDCEKSFSQFLDKHRDKPTIDLVPK